MKFFLPGAMGLIVFYINFQYPIFTKHTEQAEGGLVVNLLEKSVEKTGG
jgi:hypothetical protein